MKKHQVNFFATKSDLETLLRTIEAKRELKFVRAGLFDTPVFNSAHTLRTDANLGIAVKGDNVQEARYLVTDRETPIEIETMPQYGGGTKYAIGSQKINPNTIVFWPGGVFNGACVIAGSVGTISEDPASLSLFQLFSTEIKRQFGKIKSFYVGKDASELLDRGWRLTSSVKSPPLYDLKKG